jgi:hypothetical protein
MDFNRSNDGLRALGVRLLAAVASTLSIWAAAGPFA